MNKNERKEPDFILTEGFGVSSDPYNWILHYPTKKKDSKYKFSSRKAYYPTLETLCCNVVQEAVKGCKEAEEIIRTIKVVKDEIINAVQKVDLERKI